MPASAPVTTPVVDTTVAFELLPDHVPPEVALLNVAVAPGQAKEVPVIAGTDVVVTVAVAVAVPQLFVIV